MNTGSRALIFVGSLAFFLGAGFPIQAETPISVEDTTVYPDGEDPFVFFFIIGEKPLSISADSNTFLMGAAFADIAPNNNQGAAYVFERAPGEQFDSGGFTKLVAPDGLANDRFGTGAALSPDGNTAAVGSFQPNAATATTFDKGAVYIFERDMGGPNAWGLAKKIVGPEVPTEPLIDPLKPRNEQFGGNIQFSSDGNTLIVGDPDAFLLPNNSDSNRGAAYIFDRDMGGPGNWGLVKRLEDPAGKNSDTFGNAVALDTDTAVVGAVFGGAVSGGAAYIFDRDNGGPNMWGLRKKLDQPAGGEFFGQSVAVTTDGNTAAVSDNGAPNAGSVFIFERDEGGANQWGQTKEVLAEDGVGGDAFGEHIGFSRTDDTTLIVAAISADVDGAVNQGAAFLFGRDEGGIGNWGQIKKLLASDGAALDLFAHAVAMAGETLVIIDENGAARIFGPERFRPDHLIGAKRGRQKGNNLYNGTGTGQNERVVFRRGRAGKVFTTVQNDGNTTDLIAVAGNLRSPKFRTVCKQLGPGGGNVTGAVQGGSLEICVRPNRATVFKLVQKPRTRRGRQVYRINARSQNNPALTDLVKEIAIAKP